MSPGPWQRARTVRTGRLSTQILHEYYVTVTRKLAQPLPTPDARADVRDLLVWRPVRSGESLLLSAWEAQDRLDLSFWDALVVAAAWASGSERLLTEDLSHGQLLGPLEVVDPFLASPEAARPAPG